MQEFRQRKGIDYYKIYVPVIAGSLIWMIFAVAAAKGWFIKQIDFITAFLNRVLEETNYIILPTRYEEEDLIYKINQGLYRLKQLPKIWYDTLTAFLKELGFTTSNWNTGLWYHKEKQVYLTLYIDNIKLISPDESELDSICEKIANRFDIKNLGATHHYLGMKVVQDRERKQIWLSQEVYIKDLLK